jgi:hypothetical protein
MAKKHNSYTHFRFPDVPASTYRMLGIAVAPIWADCEALLRKRLRKDELIIFRTCEQIMRHISFVLENPDGAFSSGKKNCIGLYRLDDNARLIVVEVVVSQGEYRIVTAFAPSKKQFAQKIKVINSRQYATTEVLERTSIATNKLSDIQSQIPEAISLVNHSKQIYNKIDKLRKSKYRSIATQQIVSALEFITNSPIPVWYGSDTSIITPSQTITARYAIVALSDLQASHYPRHNFSVNPFYPKNCQQRDYHTDANEQAKVIGMAEKLNADFLLAKTPSPTDGAPIITPQGIVLGGNGRVMAMTMAQPNVLHSYLNMLYHRSVDFGTELVPLFTENHALVRVVDVDMTRCALYSNILNTNFTQKQSFQTESTALARQLSSRDVSNIAEIFSESEDDATFNSVVAKPSAVRRIIDILRHAGIINHVNIAQYTEDGATLTDFGKLAIERLLLGLVVPDKRMIDTSRKYTNSLLRSLSLLLRLKSMPAEYNIMPDILAAISAEHRRAVSNTNKALFLAQISPFDEPISETVQYWWDALDSGMHKLRKALERYVRTVELNTAGDGFDFAEPLSREQIMSKLRQDRAVGEIHQMFGIADGGKKSLSKLIQSNPYLKAQNCIDIADVEYGIASVKELMQSYPDSIRLKSIYARLYEKLNELKHQTLLGDANIELTSKEQAYIELLLWYQQFNPRLTNVLHSDHTWKHDNIAFLFDLLKPEISKYLPDVKNRSDLETLAYPKPFRYLRVFFPLPITNGGDYPTIQLVEYQKRASYFQREGIVVTLANEQNPYNILLIQDLQVLGIV